MKRPTEIWRSDSGPMAKATICFPISGKSDAKKKWIAKNSLYLANVSGYERIVAHVYWKTMYGKRYFLMDAVTGTLYRKSDGRCVTSDTLQLLGLTKNKDLGKRLLKIRTSIYGDE